MGGGARLGVGERRVGADLEALEEPVGREGESPGVEDHVVVGHDECTHHDQERARRALDDRDERPVALEKPEEGPDRKSTRLNSSHSQISYAVFCLKKKNET